MSFLERKNLPPLDVNLDSIKEILAKLRFIVTKGEPSKEVRIKVHLGSVDYTSLEDALRFADYFWKNYPNQDLLSDQVLKLEVGYHDHDRNRYQYGGYRVASVVIAPKYTRTDVYGCSQTKTEWVESALTELTEFVLTYQRNQGNVAGRIVGLSSAGVMAAGGLAAGIMFTPFALPLLPVAGGLAYKIYRDYKRLSVRNLSLLPAPKRDMDVLPNVIR